MKVKDRTAGPTAITIRIRNRQGIYEQSSVFGAILNTGQTYVARPQHAPGNYVQDDGTIALQIETYHVGPIVNPLPCASYEFANAVVTY